MTRDSVPQVHPTAVVSPDAVLGDGCRIDALAFVGSGCVLEEGVTVAVRATVVSASSPEDPRLPGTIVKAGAVIGVSAVVHGPLTIGRGAVVDAGSTVSVDVPANAIVAGNPAEVVGYTDPGESASAPFINPPSEAGDSVSVAGATLVRLSRAVDLRGSLTATEVGRGLPFVPRRMFVVFDVANRKVRGSHAHHQLHQYLVAVGGQLTVAIDDGHQRFQVMLDHPYLGLHIPPMVWASQYDFSPGCALVVLASAEYDADDYIRDYEEYLGYFDA